MKRPLALIGFSYFITLALLIFVPENILPYIFAVFSALFTISLIIPESRRNKVFPVAFLTCSAAVAVYYVNFNTNIKPVQNLDGTNATISGTICDIPYKKDNRYNYIIEIKNLNQKEVKPFKIKLSSSEAIEGDVYDKFTGNIYLYVPQNTPAFDAQTYYRSKNIYIHAFLYNYEENFTQKPEKIPPNYYILKLRQKMLSASKKIFPVRTASVINSALLGEKHELPKDIKNNFDIIGQYYLFTTSGIQISILSQLCLWLLKKLKLGNRFSAVLSALAVFLFIALTCFNPSATKAGIMCIIYLLGLAIFKKSDSLNSLGISVFLICLFSPNSAIDISLWMSFLATLGIVTAYQPIKRFMCSKMKKFCNNKIMNYIVSSISVSLAVWIFPLPFAAWFFKKTSLMSPLSNLVLIPPVTVIFNLSLIVDFFSILSAPAFFIYPPAFICGILTNFIIYISEVLAKIPFSMISLDYTVATLWASFTILFIAIGIHLKNLKKSAKLTALLSLILAFVSVFTYQLSKINTTDAAIINCSDGIGIVISKNGKRAAVLCLNKDSNITSIEYFLSKSYIKNIDYLNLPILDNTHKNNVQNIIKAYCPKMTILSAKNSAELNDEKLYTQLVYFTDHVKSSFWEGIETSTFEINKHTYIQIKISNVKFLIFTNGGNVDEIPENLRNCDFLVVNGLPINYQKIQTKYNILSANKINSEINMQKFLLSGENVFSTAHQGNIYVNIKSNGEYNIRRSQ